MIISIIFIVWCISVILVMVYYAKVDMDCNAISILVVALPIINTLYLLFVIITRRFITDNIGKNIKELFK